MADEREKYPTGEAFKSLDEALRMIHEDPHYPLWISESQRQMLILSLATFSLDRPGFDDALWDIAKKVDNEPREESMYERFRGIEARTRALSKQVAKDINAKA